MSEKILCAVDLSDSRKKVCEFAVKYAQMANAEIIALFVVPSPGAIHGLDLTEDFILGYSEELTRAANESIGAYVAENFQGVNAEGVVAVGATADTIVAEAQKYGCSMIVMGTHGRKGLNKMVFGSVASRVVASAGTIPVVTIGTEAE